MARVLRPGGRLVASSNSSRDGDIGDLICAALADVLDDQIDDWHPPLSFTAENGAAIIAEVFANAAAQS